MVAQRPLFGGAEDRNTNQRGEPVKSRSQRPLFGGAEDRNLFIVQEKTPPHRSGPSSEGPRIATPA